MWDGISFFFQEARICMQSSNDLQLMFYFVQKLSVGVVTNLPRDFIKSVQNDALRAETNHIRSIQLWRSIAIDFSYKKKDQKLLFYRAEVEEGASTKTPSIKTVFLHQNEAMFALKFEPWILDTANSLSQVHGYRKISFGDGATLKTEYTFQCKKQWYISTNVESASRWQLLV